MRRAFVRLAPALTVPAELNDASPVPLCRPAWEPRSELLRGFALCGDLEAGLATQIGFAVERLGDGGRTAHIAHRENVDFKTATLVLNRELVAGTNLAGGLGLEGRCDSILPKSHAREASDRVLKEARRPEPFVDAHCVHCDCPRSRKIDSRFSSRYFPDIKITRIAGCSDREAFLVDGTIERGANVGLGGRQTGKRDFERGAGGELINMSQKLFNDLLMFSFAALGNLVLANFLNFKSRRSLPCGRAPPFMFLCFDEMHESVTCMSNRV